jgi:hypothetical protein
VSKPLDGYDGVLLDLDGTVVRGANAVSEAPEVVNELRKAGRAVQFITNNASRAPEEVAEQLTGLGVRTTPEEVLTSGQAAATLLESLLPAGSAVLVVGAAALVAAVRSVGLRPVDEVTEQPVAVVQGHSPETWPFAVVRGGSPATSIPRCPPSGACCPGMERWWQRCRPPPAASLRWPGSRRARFSTRLLHVSARSTRWWSVTAWTPTSRGHELLGWMLCSSCPV